MPNILVYSSIIIDVNTDPLSVNSVVGRYECLVIISINTFAVDVAVASISGYANRYREKTSMAVMMQLYPPLGGKLGRRSICIASSGPKSHSGKLSSSGVIVVFGVRYSFAHVSQPCTHLLTNLAMPG